MKRLSAIILIFVMFFTLSACNNKISNADMNEKVSIEKIDKIEEDKKVEEIEVKFDREEVENFLDNDDFDIDLIGNSKRELSKKEIFSSKYLLAPDGSLFILEDDGSFKYYLSYEDLTDNYCKGNYEIYMNDEGIKKLSKEMNISEEDALDNINENRKSYGLTNFICMIVDSEELILAGEKDKEYEVGKIVYYGYYFDEYKYFDFLQMEPEKKAGFLKISEI